MKRIITLLLLCLVTSAVAQIEITDDNAEEKLLINNDRLIVVDFYATWCGPCKRMDPILKRLSKKYKGQVDFYKIDVDKNEVDDALGVTAMPTYFFIKNSSTLETTEGAMSESDFEELIIEYGDLSSNSSNSGSSDNAVDEYSQEAIDAIWYDSSALNSKAWHAYEEHNEIDVLLKSINLVKRSIELDENYHNVDTHAALLYKIGRYDEAWNKAKEAIKIAKRNNDNYNATKELLEKIVDKM